MLAATVRLRSQRTGVVRGGPVTYTCAMTPPGPPDGTVGSLAGRLQHWFERLWPDPDRGARAIAALEAHRDDERAVSAATCDELVGVVTAFSKHFALDHDPAGRRAPDVEPPGWDPVPPEAVARRAGSVRSVERRPDGVAVIAVDDLDPLPLALPYLEAAFRLAAGADGVVLDLSENGGGDPATVALVVSWVAGPRHVHISDVHYRDRTVQWWTHGRPPELSLHPATPAAVVVSGRTFSSGEALAFHLQQLCGLPVVGVRSRGAADHITPVRVIADVTAFLPEAYVIDAASGGTWEGRGVVPDVAVPEVDAREEAVSHVLGRPRRAPLP